MPSKYREDFLEEIAGKADRARKDLAKALSRAEYIASMAADGFEARLVDEIYMAIDDARDGMEWLTDATEDLFRMQTAPREPVMTEAEEARIMEVDR